MDNSYLDIDRSSLPYRKGIGAMIFNSQNLVFVGNRVDGRSEAWQMPQGGVDEGESLTDALFREIKEEVGTDNMDILAESRKWFYYDIPETAIPRLWEGCYRGQAQKWFALRFMGEDGEINLESHRPEFKEWKWINVADLPSIIVPFKRKLYISVIEEFAQIFKEQNI